MRLNLCHLIAHSGQHRANDAEWMIQWTWLRCLPFPRPCCHLSSACLMVETHDWKSNMHDVALNLSIMVYLLIYIPSTKTRTHTQLHPFLMVWRDLFASSAVAVNEGRHRHSISPTFSSTRGCRHTVCLRSPFRREVCRPHLQSHVSQVVFIH